MQLPSRSCGPGYAGRKLFLACVALAVCSPGALAAACTTVASGNWNAQTTWGAAGTGCAGAPGGIPGAADSVSVTATRTVTLTANAAAASISVAAATAANGITLNGFALNVAGALTMNAVSTNNITSTVNVGSGALTAASISIAGGAGNRVALMTVSSGSISFSGTAGNAQLTSTGASSISVGGNFGSGGTLTGGSSTLTFNGGAAQSIGVYATYNNVVIANTSGGVSFLGNATIGGTLLVSNGTLSVGAFTLTLNGDVTINGTGSFSETGVATLGFAGNLQNNGTLSASTGVHTFSGAGKTLGGANPIAIPSVRVNGSYQNNGSLTVATTLAGAGTLTNGAAGTLNIGAASVTPTLTATAVGNTVNYNGAAQTVKATAYHHLGLAGSGVKTLTGLTTVNGNLTSSGTATATTAAALAIAGNLNVGNGTSVTVAGFNISVTGTTTVAGTLAHSSATGTKTYTGDVTISGTFSEAAAAAVVFAGSLQNNGTLTASSGVHTFSGAAKTISGSNAIAIPSVTVSGSCTNNGTLTIATALAGAGALSNGATGTLNLGGTSTLTTLTANAVGNTVNYSGAAQTVKATSYHNLTISGSAVKSLAGATIVGGTLTLSAGTLAVGANTLSLNGPTIAGTPTFLTTVAGSSLSFGGSSSGVNVPSNVTTLSNLTVNNASGITLGSNVTVSGTLTLSAGAVSSGTYTLTASANCPASVSRSGGFVAGNLRLKFAAGSTTCSYDVGSGSSYAPISVNMVSAAGGTLSASTTGSEQAQITGSGINWNKDANRYWTLWASGDSIVASNYGATFNFVSGDLDSGANPASFVVARYAAGAWTLPTPVAAAAFATGVSGLGSISSATDFVVGEATPPAAGYSIQVNNFSPCISGSGQTTVNVTALDSGGNTITSYMKTVTLAALLSGGGASSGSWSVASAHGSLVGSQYSFAAADQGTASFNLADSVAESVNIRVSENGGATSTTLATAVQFGANTFSITNIDALAANAGGGVVAGRAHLMRVASACGSSYSGVKSLDGWYSRDAADPGGTAPQICATNGGGSCLPAPGSCSGALPAAAPALNAASNNLPSLTFNASGVANFCLGTSDVGLYTLSLRDDGNIAQPVLGSSSSLTVRPFAVVVSNIVQGATSNPASSSPGSTNHFLAGSFFSASVGGYLWNAAADSGANGLPGAVALATLTAAGLAAHYADTVALATDASAASNFVPNGAGTAQGALSNGNVAVSAGSGTASTLKYSEVGAFTLKAAASANYLSGGDLANRVVIYADNASPNAWVGRFSPAYFDTAVAPACGAFAYSGQPFTVAVTAKEAGGMTTSNYAGASWAKAVTLSDAGSVANLSNNSIAAASFNAGYASSSTPTYAFPAKATVPTVIALRATDSDGVSSVGHSEGTTTVNSGRLRLSNAYGSELLPLRLPAYVEYYASAALGWQSNSADSGCTVLSASDLAFSFPAATAAYPNNLHACNTAVTVGGSPPAPTIKLASPGNGNSGYADVTLNLGASAAGNQCATVGGAGGAATTASAPWLQFNWKGGGLANPTARVVFGVRKAGPTVIQMELN